MGLGSDSDVCVDVRVFIPPALEPGRYMLRNGTLLWIDEEGRVVRLVDPDGATFIPDRPKSIDYGTIRDISHCFVSRSATVLAVDTRLPPWARSGTARMQNGREVRNLRFNTGETPADPDHFPVVGEDEDGYRRTWTREGKYMRSGFSGHDIQGAPLPVE